MISKSQLITNAYKLHQAIATYFTLEQQSIILCFTHLGYTLEMHTSSIPYFKSKKYNNPYPAIRLSRFIICHALSQNRMQGPVTRIV